MHNHNNMLSNPLRLRWKNLFNMNTRDVAWLTFIWLLFFWPKHSFVRFVIIFVWSFLKEVPIYYFSSDNFRNNYILNKQPNILLWNILKYKKVILPIGRILFKCSYTERKTVAQVSLNFFSCDLIRYWEKRIFERYVKFFFYDIQCRKLGRQNACWIQKLFKKILWYRFFLIGLFRFFFGFFHIQSYIYLDTLFV